MEEFQGFVFVFPQESYKNYKNIFLTCHESSVKYSKIEAIYSLHETKA